MISVFESPVCHTYVSNTYYIHFIIIYNNNFFYFLFYFIGESYDKRLS